MQPHRRQPTRLPHPWDSPGKNTGVGCHFLLQRMKVKRESEVAQSCLTLSHPMDCSLPGSSACGIFQARVLEWGAIAFSDWMYIPSQYDVMRMAFYFCGPLPPRSITSVYLCRRDRLSRHNSHNSPFTQTKQTVGHSTICLTSKNIKSEGSLRKCHGQEEFKKTWWLNTMWYPGWDPGKEKQQEVKAREIWIKYGL